MPTLATAAESHQSRLLRRADRSADAAERAVRRVWSRVLDAIKAGGSWPVVYHAARVALRSLPSVAGDVLDELTATAQDAAKWTAAEMSRRLRGRVRVVMEDVSPLERLILPPLPLDRIHAVVYQAGWMDRVQSLTRLAQPDTLAARIATGVQNGESVATIAREIRPLVQGVQASARRVARTAGLWIAHEAELHTYEQLPEVIVGYQINAVLDRATRPEHRARDGRKFYREPRKSQNGFDKMPRPPQEADGSWAFNCVLPGNVVQGRVQAVLKASYSGEAIEIQTANGARLSVTAQHPVLTDHGFTAAGLLRNGDQLLRYRSDFNRTIVDVNYDYLPTEIENIFEAFFEAGELERGHCCDRFDLYGDAEFIEGEVHVVKANRSLLRNRFTEGQQSAREKAFARADVEPVVPSVPRAHDAGRMGLFASSGRVGYLRPLHPLGGRLVAQRHAETMEHPVQAERGATVRGDSATTDAELRRQHIQGLSRDISSDNLSRHLRPENGLQTTTLTVGRGAELDTRTAQPATYGLALHPEFAAKMRERHAGLITRDEVRDIRRFHYDGPVFDMQTDTGYFTAGLDQSNIVIANCRCWLEPILADV